MKEKTTPQIWTDCDLSPPEVARSWSWSPQGRARERGEMERNNSTVIQGQASLVKGPEEGSEGANTLCVGDALKPVCVTAFSCNFIFVCVCVCAFVVSLLYLCVHIAQTCKRDKEKGHSQISLH